MALPINMTDLITRKVVESARIEYKSDWNPEPILHSICAFANDEANHAEEKELFLLSQTVPFDDRPNFAANSADLKPALISDYLYKVNSELHSSALHRPLTDLATDMHLLGGPPELPKPLNVGLMFFNDRPETFFKYARIEVVDKPDPTGIGMTEKIFSGPLDCQLRDALTYIKNYVVKEKITKIAGQAEAVRVYNYPYAAIEEGLANAVYHKSYQIGEPITVEITEVKLEITSLPGPDTTITAEDISQHKMVSRRNRNRRIGDFLKELKLIEGRNTGVPTILRTMQQNGSPAPLFQTDSERTYFTLVLPMHHSFLQEEKVLPQKTPGKKTRRTKTEIKNLILETLHAHTELSSLELALAMDYTKVTDAVGKAIRELLDEEKITYKDTENIRSRYQKLILANTTHNNSITNTKETP